jgi:small conductance mechanosensitive channel
VPFAATISLPTAIRFQSCVDDEQTGTFCDWVYDQTGVSWLAESSDWLLAKPAAITVIVVLAVLTRFLLHRVIRRLAHRAAEGTVPGVLAKGKGSRLIETSPLLSERRKQRADTMSSVLRSITTGVVFTVAVLMILDVVGLPIGPLLASAGILGVAIGFGAQTLVKDFLSGIFMILEDQYGVGDVVDLGEASGVVEAVGLRVTRLRDVNGTVWYVRNGEILRVGNQSQGWARAVIDVGVAYSENIPRVKELLSEAAHSLMEDEEFEGVVLEEPEVWGVESLTADGVVVRVVIKTVPLEQWNVARELRQRIKATFDAHQVEIPFPQRAVWIRAAGPGAEHNAPPDDELAAKA